MKWGGVEKREGGEEEGLGPGEVVEESTRVCRVSWREGARRRGEDRERSVLSRGRCQGGISWTKERGARDMGMEGRRGTPFFVGELWQ